LERSDTEEKRAEIEWKSSKANKSKSSLECTHTMLGKATEWANPFGDGTAGERIVKVLIER